MGAGAEGLVALAQDLLRLGDVLVQLRQHRRQRLQVAHVLGQLLLAAVVVGARDAERGGVLAHRHAQPLEVRVARVELLLRLGDLVLQVRQLLLLALALRVDLVQLLLHLGLARLELERAELRGVDLLVQREGLLRRLLDLLVDHADLLHQLHHRAAGGVVPAQLAPPRGLVGLEALELVLALVELATQRLVLRLERQHLAPHLLHDRARRARILAINEANAG